MGKRAEHKADRILKERSIAPHRRRRAETLISLRKQRRLREAPFQLANDALCIAIDIGADLHHRRTAITAGQRHQVGPRHDPRDEHRRPIEVFQAKDDADLFGERRLLEMVQDDGRRHDRFKRALRRIQSGSH